MALTPASLAKALGRPADDPGVARVLPVVVELVDREPGLRSDTPQHIKDEAAIREAGYLLDRKAAGSYIRTGVGQVTYTPSHLSPRLHSSALAILGMWIEKRLAICG